MSSIIRRTAWVAVFIASLVSCEAANLRGTKRTTRTDGVLIANFWTDFEGEVSFATRGHPPTDLDVRPGQTFKILWLPAGRYQWRAITRSGGSYEGICHLNDEAFEIVADAVNYVGDYEISTARSSQIFSFDDTMHCSWKSFDRGIEMRQYMQVNHSNLLKNREFVFHAPGSAVNARLSDSVLEADEPRSPPPSPRAVIAKVLTDTATFRDQMCACADAACADRVSRAMAHWKLEFGLDDSGPKLSPEEQAQLDSTVVAFDACRAALAQRPKPKPAAPALHSPD